MAGAGRNQTSYDTGLGGREGAVIVGSAPTRRKARDSEKESITVGISRNAARRVCIFIEADS